MRLLVGDHDDAVVRLVHGVERGAQLRAAVRLAVLERIAQGKAAARRHAHQLVREGVHRNLLRDLAQQEGEAVRRVGTLHLRPVRQRRDHAAGDIHQQHGAARQLRPLANRAEHRRLERLFPLRRMTRGSQKAERQHPIGLHAGESRKHQIFGHRGLLHVAEVAEQSQRAKLALSEQTLPVLALVATG